MLGRFSKVWFSIGKVGIDKQPKHIQLLGNKIMKQNQSNPKLQFLQELRKSHGLQQYFSSKTIYDFSLEDIYFYITNKQIFIMPTKMVHLAMLNNSALDTYSCFIIAHDTQSLRDKECQMILIQLFNENCMELAAPQLIYCLKSLKNFSQTLKDTCINFQALKVKVKKKQLSTTIDYLQILYHLNDIRPLSQLIQIDNVKQCVHNLGAEMINKNTHIKYFFFINILQPLIGINRTPTIENIRQKEIQKRISSSKTQEQLEYCIKILSYYNQFTYFIKIQRLSPALYIDYLKFLHNERQINPNFSVINHLIPSNVCIKSTSREFLEIISLRIQLQLQKIKELGKLVKKVMSSSLGSVLGLLEYITKNKIQNIQVWADFEEAFIVKLHLNSKKIDIHKIAKDYEIIQIFKLLAYMSSNKLGSSTFWKHSYHFVHDFLMDSKLVKGIVAEEQNKFIIYCYKIYGMKTIPQHIQQKLKNLSLVTISSNRWTIYELYEFTKCLTFNRIGEDEIWYAIQNKFLQINLSRNADETLRRIYTMIFQYFQQMKLGSYRLKNRMLKLEQAGVFIKSQKLKQNDFSSNPETQQKLIDTYYQ